MMNEKALCTARELAIGYGKAPLLSNICLGVQPGQILTLIGPNGAGKSTLLRTLAGQLAPMGGTVLLAGKDLTAYTGTQRAQKLALMAPHSRRMELTTCFDFVSAGRYPYTGRLGILSAEDRQQVHRALELVGTAQLADRDFNRISDGQRQRILLARALCQQPEVILLDEPTSFLDIKGKIELLTILKELAHTGQLAVILSLHELELAEKIADMVVCVSPAGVSGVLTPEQAFQPENIRTLYGLTEQQYTALFGTPEPEAEKVPAGKPQFEHYVRSGQKLLRCGYTTGTCAALGAAGAARLLLTDREPETVALRTPKGIMVEVAPIYCRRTDAGAVCAIRKDGGDDPDCTHGAILFGNMRRCSASDARKEDYTLSVGGGTVILRGAAGVGLCTRPGLDCEQGKWAINTGPRRMIAENLHHAGLDAGCWLLEIGVENGEELAKHTLNPLLGVVGGISILGTTGLVRPYSHEAYIETVRICVKSHHIAHGTTMVFCTGGRTKSGAERRLPSLPETAFTCIGDFIAESLAAACEYGMREIVVACMAGKLCKYAAGFENTHAHKVSQDMDLLRAEVRKHLPGEEALHDALAHSVSVREALLSIPEADRPGILRRLARTALGQFARRCGENIALRLLVFDFEGQFLFEEKRGEQKEPEKNGKIFSGQSDPSHASASSPEAPTARSGEHAELSEYNGTIGLTYFLDGKKD